MKNTYFTWIINYTDKKYTVIGAMSANQEMKLVSLLTNLKKRGTDLNRLSFDEDSSLNEQLASFADDIKNFQFVPANELTGNYDFINIEDTFNA